MEENETITSLTTELEQLKKEKSLYQKFFIK
jgi:hypothetical protein